MSDTTEEVGEAFATLRGAIAKGAPLIRVLANKSDPPFRGEHCQRCGSGRMVNLYEIAGGICLVDYRCAFIMAAAIVSEEFRASIAD